MMSYRFASRAILALASAAVIVACDKSSDFETYVANLAATQENPAGTSTAFGKATLLLSRNANRADISLTISSGFQGTVTASHIHRVARTGPPTANGGVIFYLWVPTDGVSFDENNTIGKTWLPVSPETRSEGLTAENIDALRAGYLYVNVHSTAKPGGEIRGQLVKQ